MAKKSSFNKQRVQSRNWNLSTYVSKDTIELALKEHSDIIRAYAYILHDKFTKTELGEKDHKEPHYHIVVRLTRPLNLTTICNWFREFNADGQRINTRALPSSDFQADYEYLIHKNDLDKWQYKWSDVTGFNEIAFKNHKNCDNDIAIDALNDLLDGVSVYDVCMRYGRDVIYHFPQLKFVFDLIYYGKEYQEIKDKNSLVNIDRNLQGCIKYQHPFVDVNNIDNF